MARLFYGRLFETAPSARPLVAGADVSAQSKKLLRTINVAVASLDQLKTVLPAIEEPGRRHSSYGVRDEHYESVGAALLWALEKSLGKGFTREVEEAWATTYLTLSGAMRSAAAEAPTGPGPASPARIGEDRSQGTDFAQALAYLAVDPRAR